MIIETGCTMKSLKVRAITRYGAFHCPMPRFEPYTTDLIKKLRLEKDLKTQDALAKASGIDLNTIKRLESGMVKSPGVETLGKIGRFFGVYIYSDWPEDTNEESPDI